jgi:hypothetical protein
MEGRQTIIPRNSVISQPLSIRYGEKEKDIFRAFVEAASHKAATGSHRAIAGERHSLEMVPRAIYANDDSESDSVQWR